MYPVSVILPCRNAPQILWLCLTHLWAYCPGEFASLTLLDNVSEDPQMAAVLAHAPARGAVVVRHEQNVGVWASVNRGLAATRADRVLVITSDLLVGPNTIAKLQGAMAQSGYAMLGPEVKVERPDGLAFAPQLYADGSELQVVPNEYNGSCWLMDWARLRKAVGWYDPRFFVAYGDTDYIERMRAAELPFGVVKGAPSIHLDKQTRRADYSEEQDTAVEMEDARLFAAKWGHDADVMARHPVRGPLDYMVSKANWR